MDPVMASFKRLYDQERQHRARGVEREQQYRKELEVAKAERAAFTALCRPATAEDYAEWLIGYLESGREPSRLVDRNLSDRGVMLDGSISSSGGSLTGRQADVDWWVLTEVPKKVPSLYGAHSLNVIVPKKVWLCPERLPDTFHGRPGHSTFYFMRDFGLVGTQVPVYLDVFSVIAERMGWHPDMNTWQAPQAIAARASAEAPRRRGPGLRRRTRLPDNN